MNAGKLAAVAGLVFLLATGCSDEPTTPADTAGDSAELVPADPIDSQVALDRPTEWDDASDLQVYTDAVGMGVAYAGAGLTGPEASFEIDVPVPADSDVLNAAFYWTVRSHSSTVDDTVVINGVPHQGRLLTKFLTSHDEMWAFVFKLGGNGPGIVTAGRNAFDVEGPAVTAPGRVDGIGGIVVYKKAGGFRHIVTQAVPEFFHGRQELEGQVHSVPFPAMQRDVQADFVLFAGDCVDEHADTLWWTFTSGAAPSRLIGGGYERQSDVLRSGLGGQFDLVVLPGLTAPAGSDAFTFQVQSPYSPRGDSGIL
ncbi:MAG: hypothetical protein ACT4PE_05350, partial [Candidatus Eiseniibacteriota bacterium]